MQAAVLVEFREPDDVRRPEWMVARPGSQTRSVEEVACSLDDRAADTYQDLPRSRRAPSGCAGKAPAPAGAAEPRNAQETICRRRFPQVVARIQTSRGSPLPPRLVRFLYGTI